MTIGAGVVAAVSVLLVAAVIVVRRAPDEPARWHEEPVTATVSDRSNWYRLTPADSPVGHEAKQEGASPQYDVPVDRLATVFDEVAMADERVHRLAGSPDERFVTYVQRSAVVGFPDYLSVRFLEVGDGGSTLAVYSRARYGYGDGGVNAARVQRWVEQTTQRLR